MLILHRPSPSSHFSRNKWVTSARFASSAGVPVGVQLNPAETAVRIGGLSRPAAYVGE